MIRHGRSWLTPPIAAAIALAIAALLGAGCLRTPPSAGTATPAVAVARVVARGVEQVPEMTLSPTGEAVPKPGGEGIPHYTVRYELAGMTETLRWPQFVKGALQPEPPCYTQAAVGQPLPSTCERPLHVPPQQPTGAGP